MKTGWASILEPVRVFAVLLVVVVIYLPPLGEEPEFIERNGEFIEISQHPPILEPFYPARIQPWDGFVLYYSKTPPALQTGIKHALEIHTQCTA